MSVILDPTRFDIISFRQTETERNTLPPSVDSEFCWPQEVIVSRIHSIFDVNFAHNFLKLKLKSSFFCIEMGTKKYMWVSEVNLNEKTWLHFKVNPVLQIKVSIC